MSHFARIVCKFKDAEALKDALAAIGIATVEVHDKPIRVRSYTGQVTANKANVLVRRENIGDSAADMGWLTGENSEAWIDEYYNPIVSKHGGLKQFSAKVAREYSCAVLERAARVRGKTAQRVTAPDGSVRVFVNA
jgi:hypothetical protein